MVWLQYIFGPLLSLTSFFLIVVILLQRGKGGGLVGALGGSGGQSAFGTKFGDRLMWVTYGVAVFWMILIILSILLLSKTTDPILDDSKDGVISNDPAVKDEPPVDSKTDDKPTTEKPADEKPSDEKSTEAKPDESATKPDPEAKPGEETKPGTEATPENKNEEKPEAKKEETPKSEEKTADPAPPAANDTPK